MKNSNIIIRFLGGAGIVTGSKILIQIKNKNILIDCGLFQGLKSLQLLNQETFVIPPQKIDAVILTHGHLDHCGYLPRLVRDGFIGSIFCSVPTYQIAAIVLRDSAKIQEEHYERIISEDIAKNTIAEPLYNRTDVDNTLPFFVTKNIDQWFNIFDDISCRFHYISHILGATSVELLINNKTFVFSGDIGRENDPIMYPPFRPKKADVLFVESTYGNRIHPEHPEFQLSSIIKKVYKDKQTLIIPAFAVERTQLLIYIIWQLRNQHKIPSIPVYMDSPMGKEVMGVFLKNTEWHKLTTTYINSILADIKIVNNIHETHRLMATNKTKIIIAGSGMVSGGRVMEYLLRYLPDKNATILLTGFQAEGTLGRQLLIGAKEINIKGKIVKILARIENLEGLSAHADQNGLIDWLRDIKVAPEKIFLIHGEKQSSEILSEMIFNKYGWKPEIPEKGYSTEIKPQ